MADIGVPDSVRRNNSFRNVGMKNPVNLNRKEKVGDRLNELAGAKGTGKGDIKYVDENKHNKMGKNEFLKLLSYQMQNQDPMNPMDQSKITGEMAQFAQLEQLSNMNANLAKTTKSDGVENKFYAASFLGKEVTTAGSNVIITGENQKGEMNFHLDKAARKVNIQVFDKKNQMVDLIELEGLSAGSHIHKWDGIGLDKRHVGKGDYTIGIKAWNEKLEPVQAKTNETGVVTGVHFEGKETVLTIDGSKKIFLRDVTNFRLPNDSKVDHTNINKVSENNKKLAAGNNPYQELKDYTE